ncbi:TetR/AcrR family transcriptional regulator [Saccharibacillus sp. CPCC 101409]|uniref:TetR/AcrR family transcriptional regulator n=1 Tax=Saccharibacillus sp. CPCC 101409 TaxID=3058041 RepID=UPI00267223E6|nr:TetR/AcrR family transcriptional regulator [Saccharibacillus sp. CPCC 101409]MDO3409816.1 TetR/AcrR family transcriptional regulator [Saccharibacillus sp. CPCC 101409]
MARTREFDRARVLHKAMLLFWEKGYDATSMADLLETMGISRSSLYETFTDKHNLYLEATQLYRGTSREKRRFLLESKSAKEGIRLYFERHIDGSFREDTPMGCLVTNTIVTVDSPDDEINRLMRIHFDELRIAFRELLQRGQESGEISPDKDVDNLAYMLLTINHGINVASKLNNSRERAESMIEMVLGML